MNFLYKFLYVIAYPFFKLFFWMKFKRPKDELPGRGCLICSNHISALDPAFIGLGMKRQVWFLAKSEVMSMPIIRSLAKKFAITIRRGKSDITAIKASISAINDKKALAVFPQGTRRKGLIPSETEVKAGVAMIAGRAKCDVIPAYIYTKDYKVRLFRSVKVIYGEPIKFEELGLNKNDMAEYEKATNIIWERICSLSPENEATVK